MKISPWPRTWRCRRRRTRPARGWCRETIAREIHALLDLPMPHQANIRASRAYQLVGLVLQVVMAGLARDGWVQIPGFGRLEVVQNGPRSQATATFVNLPQARYLVVTDVHRHTPRRTVRYRPAAMVWRGLNRG